MNKEDYSKIIEVEDGRVYTGIYVTSCICNVYKIGINETDISIDCFDENDKLIGFILYKRISDVIYCEYESEDFEGTISLADNGELLV